MLRQEKKPDCCPVLYPENLSTRLKNNHRDQAQSEEKDNSGLSASDILKNFYLISKDYNIKIDTTASKFQQTYGLRNSG